MRAVIVQHEEHEDAGWFAPALREAGFALEHRFRGVRTDDAGADLVVVLGGSMSAAAVHEHPFLGRELALLVDRLARGAPCLGICLGAQLLARAAGSRVMRGHRGTELGALPIRWTPAGRADPALAPADASWVVPQWHADTFTAVPGGVLLASGDRYEQQAFRLGASFGFQFHLELAAAAFAGWLAAAPAAPTSGHDPRALAAGDAARRALVARLAQSLASICRP